MQLGRMLWIGGGEGVKWVIKGNLPRNHPSHQEIVPYCFGESHALILKTSEPQGSKRTDTLLFIPLLTTKIFVQQKKISQQNANDSVSRHSKSL